METIPNILLAALAIIGVGGLIVLGVIWLGHRAMQRQAAETADQAAKSSGGKGEER